MVQKYPEKINAANNYHPIACLPVMCKLLTSVLEEKVCAHLSEKNVLPDEQKGCRKDSRGRKNQLLIDKQILKHCKKYSIISDWEGLIRKRPVIRCCMVG